MIAKRHFPNAPIKEALIDIQVQPNESLTIEELIGNYGKFSENYSINKNIHAGGIGVKFDQDKSVTTEIDNSHVGYRFESENFPQIVQFRNNGFRTARQHS